jgi:hypothetical protein
MTETQAKKLDHEAKVKTAWASIALSPEFQTVFTDLQIRFGFLAPSFSAQDNFNPTAAAVRDGEKNVLRHIAKKLSFGLAVSEDDAAPENQREAL